MSLLQIKAAIQISKPIHEVFEAIIDPAKMANYFISEGSGRMQAGKTIRWKFPEFETNFTIKVLQVEKDEYVAFEWEGAENRITRVDIKLSSTADKSTLIKITEGKLENNEEGIKWLGGNSEGWANFLACLKAYLEYDINLRKGAFDFMRKD